MTKIEDIQVGVRSLVVAKMSSKTSFNGTPFDATPSAPVIASIGWDLGGRPEELSGGDPTGFSGRMYGSVKPYARPAFKIAMIEG